MMTNKNREAKSNLLPLYLKNHVIGKVHSKFKSGLNIQFNDSLIYISSIGTPLSSFGLNIDEVKLQQILNSARVDDIVVNKRGSLFFYCIDKLISIDYRNIEVIDLSFPKINSTIDEIANTILYNYLAKIKFEDYIGIDLDQVTCKYIDLLLSFDKSDSNKNLEIINFFSGRGKGLTPSGDDILIGFSMALMMFVKSDSWIKSLESVITLNTTTMISVAYLRALLDGYASEHFIQLVRLIDSKNINIIEETIKKVQSFGHTSGNDTLFGFFLGLKYLINQKEKEGLI
jgi:hypothetical protein